MINPTKHLSTNKAQLPVAMALLFSCIFSCVAAPSLLLDFGATVVAPSEATLDMGHFSGAVPGAEANWNQIVNADKSSLFYSDGSAATGVSIVLGRSPAGVNNSVNYTLKTISSSALGTAVNLGIYTNTSPGKDGIFATGTATVSTNVLGIRVDGLAAGTYTLYISGRNTSTGFSDPEQFFATNGASASSFSFATGATPSVIEANSAVNPGSGPANGAAAITSTFAYGDNCGHLVVTLNAGDSLFLAAIGTSASECRGFLNAVEIMPGSPALTNFPATIGTQPKSASVYEGATVTIGSGQAGGASPLYFQWYSNGVPIISATNTSLVLSNVTAAASATYNFTVSNQVNVVVSSNAILTVVPFFNTDQMTNVWNILPGDTNHFYITTTAGGERGLAYNPVSSNLLVLTHIPTNNLVVLDPATGNQKYLMNVAASGMATNAAGINMVGVADDGKVYAGNVVADASSPSTPYQIWQWADDGSNTVANLIFSGDPGYSTPAAGLRWGDNIAVRGAGPGTQILIAPGAESNGSGSHVVLLTTTDGISFSQNVISINGVASAFAQNGITFGPGTNTFWAKTLNQNLYLIQFDPSTQTGNVLNTYAPSNGVPASFQFISASSNQKWMAGVMMMPSGSPDNVRLYDISNLTNGPVLADQETNLTKSLNGFNNGLGVGSTAFGGGYLFALDAQNGVRAFLINTNTVLAPFNIGSITVQAGPAVVISWQSVAGHMYQIQSKNSLLDADWANVGAPVTAAGPSTSITNNAAGASQFYRVQGQ